MCGPVSLNSHAWPPGWKPRFYARLEARRYKSIPLSRLGRVFLGRMLLCLLLLLFLFGVLRLFRRPGGVRLDWRLRSGGGRGLGNRWREAESEAEKSEADQ